MIGRIICHRYWRGIRQTNGGQVKPRPTKNKPEFIENLPSRFTQITNPVSHEGIRELVGTFFGLV